MPSQALLGDTIVALDITKPVPDKILWKLPVAAYKVGQNSSTIFFVPTTEGTHRLEMKAFSADCENIVKHDVKVFKRESISETDSTLGFQQFKNIESVEIFPNPNDGRFKVTVKLLKLANMDVKITKSSTGQVVFTKKDTGFKIYTFEVYLSVPADVYVLTVVSDQSIFTKRIVIVN